MAYLDEYIAAQKRHDFRYGQYDCLTFGLGYYDEYFGLQLVKGLPFYDSHRAGLKVLARLKTTYLEYVDDMLVKAGFITAKRRRPTNLILTADDRICLEGDMLGIRLDETAAAFRQDSGIRIEMQEFEIVREWSWAE